MTDDSDYSLEMAGASRDVELNDIPELPESVAESPLFLLPQEIRDRVYAHCMTADENSTVDWPSATARYGLQPQLLRTCRLIYKEAVPLLYCLNNMAFHHPSDANMFVRALAAPGISQSIQALTLHMRSQDTRLWMPYLTSKDRTRSLQSDFPCLRELNIRFRSTNWQHNISAEGNLKIWHNDERLDEVVDGVRNIYFPERASAIKKRKGTVNSANQISPLERRHDPDDPDQSTRRHSPVVKILCICRTTPNHFNTLTAPLPSSDDMVVDPDRPDLSEANNGTGVIQQTPPTVPLSSPVREGAPFTGFTAVDLRSATVRKLQADDVGSASIASTVYADKDGILLALEIHCLDPKKQGLAAG